MEKISLLQPVTFMTLAIPFTLACGEGCDCYTDHFRLYNEVGQGEKLENCLIEQTLAYTIGLEAKKLFNVELGLHLTLQIIMI